MKVKDMVGQGKMVKYQHYQNEQLWYVTECGFEFPVPISETNEAIFLAQDKAILYMRWINKHLKHIELAKKEQDVI